MDAETESVNGSPAGGLGGTLALFARYAVGIVFVCSSIPKLTDPYPFLMAVYDYALLGPETGLWAARTIPALELVLGVCLIGGLFVRGALAIAAILGPVFVAAQVSVLWRGMHIGCGCFGASAARPIGYSTMIPAAGIALTAIAVLVVLNCQTAPERRFRFRGAAGARCVGGAPSAESLDVANSMGQSE